MSSNRLSPVPVTAICTSSCMRSFIMQLRMSIPFWSVSRETMPMSMMFGSTLSPNFFCIFSLFFLFALMNADALYVAAI